MNDLQVWVVIGGMGALIVGMFGVIPIMFTSAIRGLRGELSAVDRGMTSRIDALDEKLTGRIDALGEKLTVEVRFGAVEHRLGAVEDDLKLVKAHLLGTRPAA